MSHKIEGPKGRILKTMFAGMGVSLYDYVHSLHITDMYIFWNGYNLDVLALPWISLVCTTNTHYDPTSRERVRPN